ncbi:MAG: phosphoesterase [Massilia sp.]|nr:phosphoesterase [Massilia sp.]
MMSVTRRTRSTTSIMVAPARPTSFLPVHILSTESSISTNYDSGHVQFIDFFGDGTRVPPIAISAYAKRGQVDHTYFDHASISKFIERNWSLPPISARSRDNLPNPQHAAADPYVPLNRPAIGDLMNLFDFKQAGNASRNGVRSAAQAKPELEVGIRLLSNVPFRY